MKSRPETPADQAAIGALVTDSFANAPHVSGTEAQIVSRLRRSGTLILSLLSEDETGLTGHVAVSPGRIGDSAGWWCIGPIAVRPDRQGAGIGSALMRAVIGQARDAGAPGLALVGDPGWYGRFGFAARPGIGVPGVPPEVVLLLAFGAAPTGVLVFDPAFGIDYG